MNKEKLSQEIAKMLPQLREELSLSEYLELVDQLDEVKSIEEFKKKATSKK